MRVAKCLICGKFFEDYKKSHTMKYCSRNCFKKSMYENKRTLGLKHSEETKRRISLKHCGMKYPRSFGKKISKSLIGKLGKESRPWKGGRSLRNGYVGIYDRSYISYLLEHRLIMEKYLGRKLKKEEVVHHIDGNKTNNDINNLKLFPTNTDHLIFHRRIKHENCHRNTTL